MNKAKDLVFCSELFKQRNRLLAEEKRKKAMHDFKVAAEPFRKHPIATTMGILWLCVFTYAVCSVWQEEWVIIAFVAGFWLMILFMGIGYCETFYGRDETYLHKNMTEINVFLIADVIPLDKDKTAQKFSR